MGKHLKWMQLRYILTFLTSLQATIWHSLASEINGRLDFIALREHYEGVGINSIKIIKADKTIESLFFAEEKKPDM